jgi:YYY domain-containing protein
MDARKQAIQRWYSSMEPNQTFAEMQKYGIEYVYYGRMERALYGENAGKAFAELAQTGKISKVFTSGETVIYQVPVANHAPGVLKTGTLAVFPTNNIPQQSLLTSDNQSLPVVTAPGWNPMTDTVQVIALWMLAWYLIALLGLIPALWLGSTQWPWARLIGLLLLGYALWLPVSARLMYNSTTGLIVALLLTALVSLWSLLRIGMRLEPATDAKLTWIDLDAIERYIRSGWRWVRTTLRYQRGTIIRFELLFLVAFVFMAAIRMANPDVWHPIWGGEKPFEFGVLNAVLRSPVMPPYSPFFSGGTLNYYYYGYVLVSLPLRLTGIAPEIGFNLILATLYALMITGMGALVWRITKARWPWVLAVLVTGILGNVAGALPVGWARGFGEVITAVKENDFALVGSVLGDWFMGPSRVIPSTITEFPFWSFLFGDLHAHVIAMPLLMLALALAWQALEAAPLPNIWWVLSALTVGALSVTNSWDTPTITLIFMGALVRRVWVSEHRWRFPLAILQGLAVAGMAVALYLPFFQQYVPQVGAIDLIKTASPWAAWSAVWGLFLIPSIVITVLLAWNHRVMRILAAVVLVVLMVIGLVTEYAPQVALAPVMPYIDNPRIWLAAMVLLLVPFLFKRQPDNTLWFGLWLMAIAWGLSGAVEFIYLRDHMSDGDWYRMNTVFKFGMQSWLLLTVGIAAALPALTKKLDHLPRFAATAVLALMLIPLLLGVAFPVAAIPSRVNYKINPDQAATLDGLAFMNEGTYETYDKTIPFTHDYQAMEWLKQNVKGAPVVLQSSIEFYRGYGVRIAANTGFPTVVSPLHESEQRNPDVVGARDSDVIEFYRSEDPAVKRRILSKYRVSYVVVGMIERAAYGEKGAAVIAEMQELREVYKNSETKVYAVSPNIVAIAPYANVSGEGNSPNVGFPVEQVQPVEEDVSTLEESYDKDPANISVMMELVGAYRRNARLDDAAAVLQKGTQAHPGDIPLLHIYGDISIEAGLTDQGIAAYREAIKYANNPGNINKLISGYINAGLLDEGLAEVNAAIAQDPTFYDFLMTRANISSQLGDFESARTDYNAYLDNAPADAIFREDVQRALDALN